MTGSRLLALICAALLAQVIWVICLAMWKRRQTAGEIEPRSGDPPTGNFKAAAWPGWRSFRIASRRFEDESQSQCSFSLEPDDALALPSFLPGQFLTFALPIVSIDAATTLRCYSISDRPDPAAYRITVKRALPPPARPDVPSGVGSAWFLDEAKVGDLVQVRAPAGQFVIDDDVTITAVFIAGGIGITPMLSMIL